MDLLSRVFSHEDEEKLRKLTFIRLVVATVIVGAAIMVLQIEGKATSMAALYSLLGVIYLSTGSAYLVLRGGASLKPVVWTLIFVDLSVLTLMIHYSGGCISSFTILLVLPVLTAGIYFKLFGGLITAGMAASTYIIYTFLEFSGHIHPLGSVQSSAISPGILDVMLRVYVHNAMYIFTGLISGYISRRIDNKKEELEMREEELRSMQLSTDSIVKNMSSGLIVANMCGEILYLNPAAVEILGIDGSVDYKGKLVEDVLRSMPTMFNELHEAIKNKRTRKRHELVVEKGDGEKVPIGISVSLLRGESSDVTGVIALFQDLKEVHTMRERVRQVDRMVAIGELSASIAHEIRVPLASICGSIEMLQEDIETTGENRDLMNLIMKESDRLDGIITDFLEFASLRKPSLALVDIELCLKDTLRLLNNSSDVKSGISFKVENVTGNTNIYVDDEQIKQVFLNIGINACEAMEKEGHLKVSISNGEVTLKDGDEPTQCLRIEFTNDGPPIPAHEIPRLFEPFFTTKERGTGLGLATASKIVENHNGMINVESSDTKGTAFSVYIPQAPLDRGVGNIEKEKLAVD